MFRITLFSLLITMVVIVDGPMTQAGEQIHHEAHEHGVARLNVAVEGNNLYIELRSPAANIVGFEHPPRTGAQKDAVSRALKELKAGDKWFIPSPGSGSRLASARVETDIDHHDGHTPESDHDQNQNEPRGSKESRDEDHRDADAHEHERHSEFTAEYLFMCKNPKALSHVDVKLFQNFPGIEHIEVQLITEKRQNAQDLTSKENTIRF